MTQYEFDTPHPLPLYVQIGRGQVQLTAADTTRCLVETTGPGAEEVEVQMEDGTLRVIQPQRAGFLADRKVTARIVVPTGSEPVIRTGSADVTVAGTIGEAEIRTGSGDVHVEAVAASASIETGSGDLRVDEAAGPLRLKSGSGDLRVGVAAGPVAASTGSGDVQIDVGQGPISTKTGSGDLGVRHAGSNLAWQTGTGDLTVQRIDRGQVRAKSASGDVTLGVPAGLPVWTDIHTTTGDVTSDLQPVGRPADDEADRLEVRVTTATGDVRLHQAQ